MEIGEKKKEEKTPLPPVPGGVSGGGAVIETNLWGEFAAAWSAAGLPGGGKIQRTPARVGLLQMRLAADDWRARWREALTRAGRSPACRGEDPNFFRQGLRLDTFLKDPDMLVRVLEGEFDPRPAAGGAAPAPDRRQAAIDAAIAEAKQHRRVG